MWKRNVCCDQAYEMSYEMRCQHFAFVSSWTDTSSNKGKRTFGHIQSKNPQSKRKNKFAVFNSNEIYLRTNK